MRAVPGTGGTYRADASHGTRAIYDHAGRYLGTVTRSGRTQPWHVETDRGGHDFPTLAAAAEHLAQHAKTTQETR